MRVVLVDDHSMKIIIHAFQEVKICLKFITCSLFIGVLYRTMENSLIFNILISTSVFVYDDYMLYIFPIINRFRVLRPTKH